jgi:hypothetical protein
MYYNHNLRTNLQERKNRLYRGTYKDFSNQLKYFFDFLDKEKVIKNIIDESCRKYNLTEEELRNYVEKQPGYINFENQEEHAAFSYQLLKYIIKIHGYNSVQRMNVFQSKDFDSTKTKIIEEQISGIINHLHDQLENSNSTIYLLEKYKMRTEWFSRQELVKEYNTTENNFEQIFEDNLRLFLFDQGIDYPFSTPKSSSGRADIVGAIDTSDPLVIEIKIFDRSKKYGKSRIKDGFNQIVKYTNDFNKEFGYLVIFNMDKAELNLKFTDPVNMFPPSINFNNKTFFFIIINLYNLMTASKQGQLESIEITQDDLIK